MPYGDTTARRRRLTFDLRGRLAKFTQMAFTKNEMFNYLILDCTELIRLGYPTQLVTTSRERAASDLTALEIGEVTLTKV